MDDRLLHLRDSHVLPLTILIEKMRDRGKVPHIDPRDGGIKAQVLIFLETPGPKAVNGFVSRDNDDPTARNFKNICEEVGLCREVTALWNVVPQCLSTPTKSVNPKRADIRAAIDDTRRFIAEFKGLRAIVFCGGSAKYSRAQLNLDHNGQFSTYHTGDRAYHRYYHQIRETFTAVTELTQKSS
jgi:hypothetical protein